MRDTGVPKEGEDFVKAKLDSQVPGWLQPGKLRWVWALWEPMAHYRRQGGNAGPIGIWNARWNTEYYERMHSEQIVAQLAELGINVVTTCFFKGFGIESGLEEMDKTAAFAELCHRYGIRVLGYMQLTTIIYETLLKEIPDLENWAMVDASGNKITYGGAYWRWLACATCDEHIEYLKRVIYKALVEAKLDGMHWDGGTYDCHCERCQQRFREYLRKKYRNASRAEIEERFGIGFLDFVRIPPASNPRDPLYRELVAFRNTVKDERLFRLHQYLKELNPEAVVATYLGSTTMERSDGYQADLIILENWDLPHVHGEGEVINRVRWSRMARVAGRMALSTSWLRDPDPDKSAQIPALNPGFGIPSPRLRRAESRAEVKLDLAEHGAYGGDVIAATWALRPGTPPDGAYFERPHIHAALSQYMRFYRDHEKLWDNAASLANVALYWSYESMSFDPKAACPALLGFEQALIWRQVPHQFLPSGQKERMGEYDVIILAGQTCLSDEEAALFEQYVNSGGGLVIAGRCGLYDQDLRQRLRGALDHLVNRKNVAYLPDVLEGIKPWGSDRKPDMNYIAHIPPCADEMVAAVRRVTRRPLPLTVKTQGYVAADLYKTRSGAIVLHLVNYENEGPPKMAEVTFHLPLNDSVQAVLYTPDDRTLSGSQLPVVEDDSGFHVIVPHLETYACLALRQ
jgi:hypothetical protein